MLMQYIKSFYSNSLAFDRYIVYLFGFCIIFTENIVHIY